MPTCNKITCTILLPPTDTPLPEYKRRYLDSSVSVYVPVPDIPILKTAPAFNINLHADDYIAPGLATFVFIDGIYQANRSKLVPPPGSAGGSGLRMTLRQKEEKVAGGNGGFVGREWRWVELDVEEANQDTASSKDAQSRVGKIEVVVLRCAEREPLQEPRARAQQTPTSKIPAKATSARAPSAKAPSVKAPSKAKAASEASAGLGGLFGAFCDGACDLDFNGVGGEEPSQLPQIDYEGRHWDATEGRYKFSEQETSILTGAEQRPPPFEFGLDGQGYDGQGYDHPGFIVNQYGLPYDPRVPYYHTPSSWRPNQQRPGYAPHSVPPAPIQVAHGRPRPPQDNLSRPPIYDAHGNPYLDRAALHQGYPVPMPTLEQPHVLQQGAPLQSAPYPHSHVHHALRAGNVPPPHAQHIPAGYEAVPQGYPAHITHDGVRYYPGPKQELQQPRPVHHRSQPIMEPHTQHHQIVDPEYQQFHIFKMRDDIEHYFGCDHRFLSEAVPYLPVLQAVPITETGPEQNAQLKRQLWACINNKRWPTGEPMGKLLDLLDPHREPSKSMTPSKPDKSNTLEKGRTSDKSSEKMMTADDRNTRDVEFETLNLDSSAGSKSSKHTSKSEDKSKYGDNENENDSKSTELLPNDNNNKNGSSSSSSDPWRNNADQDQNGVGWNKTEINSGDQDNHLEAAENNNTGGQEDQPNTGWGTTETDQKNQANNSPSESTSSSDTDDAPGKPNDEPSVAGDGAGWGNAPSTKASSSRHSKSSISSSDPRAYIQPYFQTWRGNTQNDTTKLLRHQPREPYAYPAAPAPHLPASKISDRSHGVQAGKGADYIHRTYRPKYLDSEESPYAVFVFHYRSAEKLEEILGRSVKDDLARVADEVGRGVLMALPREKLVGELLKSQGRTFGGDDAAQEAPQQSSGFAPAAQDTSWNQESTKRKAKSKPKSSNHKARAQANKSDEPNAGNWGTTPAWGEVGQGTTGKDEGFTADPSGGNNPTVGW